MGQDKFGHMATLKLMAQRPITHYTLDKLRDLVMVSIAWPATMGCSFQLLIGTMMPGVVDNVQTLMQVVDGGMNIAIEHF